MNTSAGPESCVRGDPALITFFCVLVDEGIRGVEWLVSQTWWYLFIMRLCYKTLIRSHPTSQTRWYLFIMCLQEDCWF